MPVDLGDTRDEPVGRRALDQLLARAPLLLRGKQQRPVLDVAVLVDELCEVLAGRSPAALAPFRDRLRARRVEPDCVPLADRLEIGAEATRARVRIRRRGAR
jgi:hypothetical protein